MKKSLMLPLPILLYLVATQNWDMNNAWFTVLGMALGSWLILVYTNGGKEK